MSENNNLAAFGGTADMQQLAEDLIGKMRSAGADAADLLLVSGTSVSVSCRLGEVEDVERSEGQDLGLRAFIGNQQAVVSTSDLSAATLDEMVSRVVAMARSAPADPYCGLADAALLAKDVPDLDIYDASTPEMPELIDAARQCEDAARGIEGITNSEGASTGWGHSQLVLATSGGFNQGYRSSS
ncbi:MAG TPA: modulator protein, partial [Alphaproteobacteria bacterium]|nr:modulator protein [Alphaproteobacteria bacterium]